MSDEIDRASELEEKHRTQALLLRKPHPVAVGFCHFCGDVTTDVFCCTECRDDWQVREDAKKRNGK